VALPWEGVVLSEMALDPSGTVTNNDVSEAFSDGVLVLAGAKVEIKPFGLVGYQSVSGTWSNKERVSLTQDPSNIARGLLEGQFPRLADPGPVLRRILERFFPELLVPVQPLNKKSDTWAVSQLRPVSLAAEGRPQARHRRILHVRRFRRQPEPHQVHLQRGHRRQRGGPRASE
jgi:hypothetical protein